MTKVNLTVENLENVKHNLIQEAVRHIQEWKVYQNVICKLVEDRENNQREINEYSEKVITAKSAFAAVSGVAAHCFGFSVVDFENQAYAVYEHYQNADIKTI